MAIFSIHDLLQAEQAGRLRIPERADFSAFSLNVHIDKLYHRLETKAVMVGEQELAQEEFLEQVCEEIPFDQGTTISPHDFYLWQPREEIFLGQGLAGEITSRSSWARLGMRAQSKRVDDYLSRYHEDVTIKPLCTLKAMGTSVIVKRGDAIGQLFVDDGPEYCSDAQMYKMVESGEFTVTREGQPLRASDLNVDHGMLLTLGKDLLVYPGGLLQPGQDNTFIPRAVGRIEKHYFPQGAFFLSASSEYVEIPEGYAGYVVEREPQLFHLPFASHPNAPYIGPKSVFKGRITFENYMMREGHISEGMVQSKLLLKSLRTPLQNHEVQSRYNHQTHATASRL